MARILLLYSTVDGQTRKIAERLADVMGAPDRDLTLAALDATTSVAPDGFDAVVIGASIRYGHHRPEVAAWIARHQTTLESTVNGFYSVNVVARKPTRNTPETNPYLRKFLRRIDWRPQHLAVFAGRIDYPRYGVLDRNVIRLIMWMTHGPTDPDTVIEYTDWAQVERFAQRIVAGLTPSAAPAAEGLENLPDGP